MAPRHPAEARHALLRAALDVLYQERCLDTDGANSLALREAEKRLDFAAKDLTEAIDAQPFDKRPKGWEAA